MLEKSRQNKFQELKHAEKIGHNLEFYWNSGTEAGLRGSLRRAEWIMNAAQFGKDKHVLEVGCGTGFFSSIFSKKEILLHGIDLVPDLIARAKERCGDQGVFTQCDVEKMPFPDTYFDAVVGIRVLHHLDLELSFKEIKRVLKSGGWIAFCEPNMLNPQIMIQKNVPWIKKWMGDTPDETAFFKGRLHRFLREQGFRQISVEPFDFLHPWIPKPVVSALEPICLFLEKIPGLREMAGSLRIVAQKQ